MLETVFFDIKKKAKIEYVSAFLSCFIIGLLTHLFKFTNTLPNFDALSDCYRDQNVICSGRWFLNVTTSLSSYFDLPLLNGILSILYLSLSAVIIVAIFKNKNPVVSILIGGIIATFPSVTHTFLYEYTADGYFFAFLMGTLAVYLLIREGKKKKLDCCVAIILLILTCASYQAYYSYSLMLMILYFIYQNLFNTIEVKKNIKFIIKQIVIFGVAFGLYYIILQILLRVENVDTGYYLDNSSIFNIDFINIFNKINTNILFLITEGNLSKSQITPYVILNSLFLLLSFIMIVLFIKNKNINKKNILFLIIAFVLLYPAEFIWGYVNPMVSFSPMIMIGIVSIIIFVIVSYEKSNNKIIKNAFAIIMIAIIFNNAVISNIGYYYLDRCMRRTNISATEMISDINDFRNTYGNFKDITIIGFAKNEEVSNLKEVKNRANIITAYIDDDYVFDNYSSNCYSYLRNFCGLNIPEASDEKTELISNSKTFSEMSNWPESNSMKIFDETLVIKISDNIFKFDTTVE